MARTELSPAMRARVEDVVRGQNTAPEAAYMLEVQLSGGGGTALFYADVAAGGNMDAGAGRRPLQCMKMVLRDGAPQRCRSAAKYQVGVWLLGAAVHVPRVQVESLSDLNCVGG
eukprot:83649-Chlamydomonas_euryale.AAC.1